MDDDVKDQLSLFGQLEPPPAETPPKVVTGAPPVDRATKQTPLKKKAAAKPAPATGKASGKAGKGAARQLAPKAAPKTYAAGLVPAGDVRLTINIRQDLHLRLKIAAAHGRTTIGEIIEELVEQQIA